MIKILASKIRQYKRPTILAPVYVSLEVILECIIPLIMASLIDNMTKGISAGTIAIYAVVLITMAMLSLACGVLSGKAAATAGCGFAKNLRLTCIIRFKILPLQILISFQHHHWLQDLLQM